jgi:hemerythrin-like domain-containing protein
MKATGNLKDEHEGIKLMLRIMEKIICDVGKGNSLNTEHFEHILEFLTEFADKCHHGKEEEILFPLLEAKGLSKENGPLGRMLQEHELVRELIHNMKNSCDEYKNGNDGAVSGIISNSKAYIQLLHNHIEKENNVLFMMADRVLDETVQNEVFEAFEKYETDVIGTGRHEEFHRLLRELRDIYL